MNSKGFSSKPEYETWRSMIRRCVDPEHKSYHRYGGKGVRVCQQWMDSFDVFLSDIGPKPTMAHSIDRIDGAGNYEPGNVRWATPKEQSANRPNWNREIEFNGEVLTITGWAERIGVGRSTLRSRLDKGWPIHEALTTPRLKSRSYRANTRAGVEDDLLLRLRSTLNVAAGWIEGYVGKEKAHAILSRIDESLSEIDRAGDAKGAG